MPALRDLPTACTDTRTAHFAVWRLPPDTAVLAARGEIDASNAGTFTDYALAQCTRIRRLVVDLSAVEFFGIAGFSSLQVLSERCTDDSIAWQTVPSTAVRRLLRICDPTATVPVCDAVDDALCRLAGRRPSLELVTKPR